ncbi:MAG TPA: FAD-binding protein, partial [Paludibacteraceae bacterium]|nr:FAD-binding protein [Paludibacteraceae bacterium]
VRIDDFVSGENPLDGLNFRQIWERKAFIAGGSDYKAPAQRVTDFLSGKTDRVLGRTSFLPGVQSAALETILPGFIIRSLKCGIKEFDKKMFGFITRDAHLIGVETRTSSPVRVCRGSDGQSSSIRGLYPCGEGAGYAGGIVSSAIDGINAAQNLINSLS